MKKEIKKTMDEQIEKMFESITTNMEIEQTDEDAAWEYEYLQSKKQPLKMSSTDTIISTKKMYMMYSINANELLKDEEKSLLNNKRTNKELKIMYNMRKKAPINTKSNKERMKKAIEQVNKNIMNLTDAVFTSIDNNKEIRVLNSEALSTKNLITCAESNLSRLLGIKTNTITRDLIVLQVRFNSVLKQIIEDGFFLNGEKYIFFSASAGQTRNKEVVFIREKVYQQYELTITCGLTKEKINKLGGVNINKYLAYKILYGTSTQPFPKFNIDKCIVLDDFESIVCGLVDHIDTTIWNITREIKDDVNICHSDGAGLILPRLSKKAFQFRSVWLKGLLIPCDFKQFCKENGKSIVTDIDGKEWDLLKDDIEIIFTKSQFKMWQYYKWEEYQDSFKKYGCTAGICNIERDLKDFEDKRTAYQLLQTLDLTDLEIETLCKRTIDSIKNAYADVELQKKIMGNKDNLGKAVELYPELLNDAWSRKKLTENIADLKKDAKSAKLYINSKYTFIMPDVVAMMQYFLKLEVKGALKNGQVTCKLFEDEQELDILRNPHLSREHCVRKNILKHEWQKYFCTNGIYTSCFDLISKVLQFDVDGDTALVTSDTTMIQAVKRYDIVPLYYEMAKAGKIQINAGNIFKGLKDAYDHSNIGKYSNAITRIWNKDEVTEEDEKNIKILTALNNFQIDYAKTGFMPDIPEEIDAYLYNHDVPYFFRFAKDKKNTLPKNKSCVNRISAYIEDMSKNMRFKTNTYKFSYKMMLTNANIRLDKALIQKHKELNRQKNIIMMQSVENKGLEMQLVYQNARKQLLEYGKESYVTDVLIKHLYDSEEQTSKKLLWECFGEQIVKNLLINTKKYIICEKCSNRTDKIKNNQKFCKKCKK